MQPEEQPIASPDVVPAQPVNEPPKTPEAEAPQPAPDEAIQQAPDTQSNSAEQQTAPVPPATKQTPKNPSSVNVPMIVAIVVGLLLIASTIVAYTQG